MSKRKKIEDDLPQMKVIADQSGRSNSIGMILPDSMKFSQDVKAKLDLRAAIDSIKRGNYYINGDVMIFISQKEGLLDLDARAVVLFSQTSEQCIVYPYTDFINLHR